jgi:hypothetical protein
MGVPPRRAFAFAKEGTVTVPADFLEKYPLYKSFAFDFPSDPRPETLRFEFTAINMNCERCGSRQTFAQKEGLTDAFTLVPGGSRGGTALALYYTCAMCSLGVYRFYLRLADDQKSVWKIGQDPPWSIEPTDAVKKALGGHIGNYKKGLINESQGYGIGAFAYYRRIVEEIIGELLDEIGDLIKEQPDHADYLAKLATVKDSKSAEKRIEVVKDLLPSVLRQRGINPLGELHDALSRGLHAESDVECLNLAGIVRECLVFLIEQVSARKKQGEAYATNIQALRKKLDKEGKAKTDPK